MFAIPVDDNFLDFFVFATRGGVFDFFKAVRLCAFSRCSLLFLFASTLAFPDSSVIFVFSTVFSVLLLIVTAPKESAKQTQNGLWFVLK